ncbi:hypothetical protein IW262DRAFT_1336895 [Armillaria fumosa]|nr:hypothetical protein IW262DRAFT_1336895 [Armillaria fumosa]
MPEYVYALHDFIPENEDEVPFRAGERIEVIEKDDAYGDGWWTGLNVSGKKGLFPQSYTSPTEPVATAVGIASSSALSPDPDTTLKTPLQPLHEEPEIESPQPPPAIFLNGLETDGNNGDGEVMKATMTDVQKAIEQLGRGNGVADDTDGARSFSFASSRGGRDTEEDTDFDMSDADAAGDEGEGWHKGARRKLAEKARQAVEDAERLEMIGMSRSSSNRTYAPPIPVELSDESEDEEGDQQYTQAPGFQSQRRHSHITEEDEDIESVPGHTLLPGDDKTLGDRASRSPRSSTHFSTSERDEVDTEPATATRINFAAQPERAKTPLSENQPTSPQSVTLVQAASIPMPLSPPETNGHNTPVFDAVVAFPSQAAAAIPPTTQSKHNSATSSPASPSYSAPGNDSSLSATVSTIPTPIDKKEKTHPSEWSLDDVIDWLKNKGFDQDVCEKFTEQEITGDVLLELDVNLLKTEIGIMAFGKRMRIANAITDLRRPPSIIYSDHPDQPSPPSPMIVSPHLFTSSPATYAEGPSHSHSRNQSQSQSHHSYPGSTRYSHSVQSSVNGFAALISPESAPQTADTPVSPRSTLDPEPESAGLAMSATNGKAPKSRPSQLSLSPSDGALNASIKAVGDIPEEVEEEREERAALSEGEGLPSRSVRRRLFGRSQDSENSGKDSGSRASKDGISPSSSVLPVFADKDKDRAKDKTKDKYKDKDGGRHGRKQRSVDVGKSGERLSLFAGSFGGTLGKSRKPPPKYSGDDVSEKGSSFHLPRLYSTSGRKLSSGRPSTPGAPKRSSKDDKESFRDGAADKERKDSKEVKEGRTEHATLRKRTSSYPGSYPASPELPKNEGTVGQLKPGQSILEQIGEPDHTGWMRKRGDRYNSWKLRYFVLKGPHLYCLRSDSLSETKIKGYINIIGYRVTVDENVNPGKYGFRIEHEHDKMHFFSSDEKVIIRDWMKAIMKATIARDYTQPVISSCNIPTIPLMVAQAMNPAPRPPSPTARDATQKALRRDNPNQLSSRDARVLMGLPSSDSAKEERTRLESFFSDQSVDLSVETIDTANKTAPPRPSRRQNSTLSVMTPMDSDLIEWANSHLPSTLQIKDTTVSIYGGLHLFRIAESIKGRPVSPPVPDSAFPVDSNDEKLDGLFRLFDFLLDHDVKMGSVSINDVRQGKPEKIVQLLRALKAWEDKRKALAQSIRGSVSSGSVSATGFMATSPWTAI